jgi:hypothetical protein
MSSSMAAASTTRGLAPLIAFGITLARRGPMAVVSLAVSALTVLAFVIVGVVLGIRDVAAPVHDVPVVASSALAWGGGILLAFAASASALRRDRTTGIHHLFVARVPGARGYLLGRVGGLAALLALVTGGGTLLVGLVAILVTTRGHGLGRTIQATLASVAFALAFALVVAPLALAALGARKRVSGYLTLLAILVVPEIVVSLLSSALPTELLELCSVPSALAALRAAISAHGVDPLRALRALVALGVFAAAASLFLRREVVLLEFERDPT